jgi:hypothetical protein
MLRKKGAAVKAAGFATYQFLRNREGRRRRLLIIFSTREVDSSVGDFDPNLCFPQYFFYIMR